MAINTVQTAPSLQGVVFAKESDRAEIEALGIVCVVHLPQQKAWAVVVPAETSNTFIHHELRFRWHLVPLPLEQDFR